MALKKLWKRLSLYRVKKWRDLIVSKETAENETLKAKMEDLDKVAESRDLSEDEVWVQVEGKKDLKTWNFLKIKT